MRLINVKTVLQIESGNIDPEVDVLVDFNGAELSKAKYAILSHCWGTVKEEVQFKEMYKLARMEQVTRDQIMKRSGYQKILKSCQQASRDDFWWMWADTCCIDKRSSSELSEAINSMYRWYENSEQCYAYLHDIDESSLPTGRDDDTFGEFNGWPKWFSRGWTLQELVAPTILHFFNRKWECMGDKRSLAPTLTKVTRIPESVLEKELASRRLSVARIISWAADRTTTREEDRAYSLLGLLGVHMPMLYGEGKNAFRRLQIEIIRQSNDQSIFAWSYSKTTGCSGSFLADDPSYFRDCSDVDRMERDVFIEAVRKYISKDGLAQVPEERLRTFSVTNDGIQIWLPLRPCRRSASLFEAQLACCLSRDSLPMSIVLARFQSSYFRYFCDFKAPANAEALFQQAFLPYQDERRQGDFTFNLDLRALSQDGFVRRSVFPDDVKFTNNSVTLSSTNDCAIIIYECSKDNTIFALSLCYSFGQHSVHVICCRSTQNKDFAAHVYRRTRQGDLEQTHSLAESWRSGTYQLHFGGMCLVKHAHFPQSIQVVRLAYTRHTHLENRCALMIDITQCTGCCSSNWEELDDLIADPGMPGLTRNAIPGRSPVYNLLEDSSMTHFVLADASEPEIKLGDYGRFRWDGTFEREGNISDLATKLGIKRPFDPDEHKLVHENDPESAKNVVKATSRTETLILHDAIVMSLPNNDDVFSLLKSLSVHLVYRHLVSKVIRCSECFSVRGQKNMVMLTWSQVPDLQTKLDIPCPLYTVTTPLVWHQEAVDEDTWTWFHEIRHNFYMLLGTGTDGNKETAVKVMTDVFGGRFLSDFLGDIMFFRELGSWVEDGSNTAPDKETDKDRFKILQGTKAMEESRIETLATKLIELIDVADYPTLLFTHETRMRHGLEELRSKSLVVEVCRKIGLVYNQSCAIYNPSRKSMMDLQKSKVDDSRRTVQSLIKESYLLQKTLDRVEDDDERRSLEEDMTGKIVLACWLGICCEIGEVVTKVVDHIVNDKMVSSWMLWTRARRVEEFGKTFLDAIDERPDDGQHPLERVLADAKMGVSKHQILLAARAARNTRQSEEAVGSGEHGSEETDESGL